ncbi:PGF-pre-PGF domain-containing protein [Methanosarcina sp.]|uniref:PGF-pre-PGF domain-containing protein n=1 Tax=Methanosarcina sp. TaxID=2213 RepID=UPI003C70FD2C
MERKNILYSKTFVSVFLVSFLIFVSSTTSAAPVPSASPAATYAYIPNQNGTVSVLDTANNTVIASVPVGKLPLGVAVTSDATKVYVANQGSGSVSVIDTATNTVTATVPVEWSPRGVAVSPDGTKVYVTACYYGGIVSIIDTATDTVTETVDVEDFPTGVAVTPDGTKVYVANWYRNVSVINTSTNTVIATVNVGSNYPHGYPHGVAVNPEGTKVYVSKGDTPCSVNACYPGNGTVSVIDTATNNVTATVPVGQSPGGVAVTPDGKKVYVANSDPTVSIIDTATNTVTATINVGNRPYGVAVNPAGTKVYVTNPDSGMVSLIDTTTNKVTATVNVGGSPTAFGQFIAHPSALKPVLIVNFSSNISSGYAPLAVQFTDLSQNATEWYWEFGDGTTSTEQNPTHIYSSAGPYTVKLIATNENDIDSKFAVVTILDYNVPPVANFAANPSRGGNPLFVQFTDLSQNAAGWNWDFGDGATSTLQNPRHVYIDTSTYCGPGRTHIQKNYIVTLTLSNENVTASKTSTIYMDLFFIHGPSPSKSTSSGGGGSPEPATNVEVKDFSQRFVTSGNSAKFDFPKNATSVVSVSFDSKKTAGKIATNVEILKNKSILTSDMPTGEVYKYLNVWVGNGGFGTSKNIENAVVCFKVERSWIQDEKIDPSFITLNRYSDNKWSQLSTNLSGEDEKYLYFTAQTLGFSQFAITDNTKVNETEKQSGTETGTQSVAVNEIQNEANTRNTTENIEQTPEQKQSPNTSAKESKKTPSFEIASDIACLLCVFLYKRR